ncbi:MAG: carbohydrate kinase [Pseudomonadota bacterium]
MIITCGEALFDVFADGAAGEADPFAISARGVVGGSPLNVALGLSRMGSKSGIFTRVSTDALGQKLSAFLDENGVSRQFCVTTDKHYTTFVLIQTKPDGQPDYAIYCNGTADCSMEMADIPETLSDDVKVIHLGSFATVLPGTGDVHRAFAKREAAQRFITYDPNVRTMVEPDLDRWREINDDLVPIANFVKASDEDLHILYPDRPIEHFAEDVISKGADICIVTCGPDGALIMSKDGQVHQVSGVTVDVKDTVGAGDTFQAACLHFLEKHDAFSSEKLAQLDLLEMGNFATHAAALTCTRRGADLPTGAEIEAFMASSQAS